MFTLSLRFLFQFTPLREGRLNGDGSYSSQIIFQFTPLREGRREPSLTELKLIAISIHAPTRGATEWGNKVKSYLFNFNSRPYARGDLLYGQKTAQSLLIFQFTPLREGRQQNQINNHICFVAKLLNIKYSFSSTARMGKKASISRPCSSVFLRLPPSIFCIGMVGAPSQ